MTPIRPLALSAAMALAGAPAGAQVSDGVVKVGVLTDFTGPYSDPAGSGSLIAAQMAAEDFGGTVLGKPIVIVSADHQNKADIASGIARRWIDEKQVDAIGDIIGSSTALAVMPVAAEKKRITLLAGPGAAQIDEQQCTAYNVHYVYNTHALAAGAGRAIVEEGGDSWFFIAADYVFGKSLESETSAVVKAAGGKVLGTVWTPFPCMDFSSYLLRARSSGAKIIGLAEAGADNINAIKQAHEFRVAPKQTLAGLVVVIADVHSLGLETAQGLYLTTPFYWDRDDATRSWSRRFFERARKMPGEFQAGLYSELMHYFRAIQAAGTDDADAVMRRMKDSPVDDFFAQGRIGPDGLLRHDTFLYQVKTPVESRYAWDYLKLVKRIPASEAYAPPSSKCPLVK